MIFRPDRTVVFEGGFEFWSPSSWSYDPDHGELSLVLGGTHPFPTSAIEYQHQESPTTLLRFDPAQRRIVYRFPREGAGFVFQGFVFSRSSCGGELGRRDAHDLVEEWVRRAGEPEH